MVERRCRYCQRGFQPSKYQPGQAVCSDPGCQRQRRTDYHRRRVDSDPEYRQVCLESCRKWRAENRDYWRRYRETNAGATDRNRRQQQLRDRKQRLQDLANNNAAFDLKHSAAEVWFVGPSLELLANNNSVPAQVWIIEELPPRKPPVSESCKQQPSGAAHGFAG